MHESYTRTGKIVYNGGHTDDELIGINIEMQGIPINITLEKDGFKSTVATFEQSGTIKLSINYEYESDALTALDAIIASAFEAKRAIESRHQFHAKNLNTWADELKESQKRCSVCKSAENLEAHHLESKHYSPSLMLSLGNGIVLCAKCHDEFHVFCGTKKVSRHDFYKWLKTKGKKMEELMLSAKNEKSALDEVNYQNLILSDNQIKGEVRHAMKRAIEYHQKHKELPTIHKLSEIAGVSTWHARVALNNLQGKPTKKKTG